LLIPLALCLFLWLRQSKVGLHDLPIQRVHLVRLADRECSAT
jgi:hypothetical protein